MFFEGGVEFLDGGVEDLNILYTWRVVVVDDDDDDLIPAGGGEEAPDEALSSSSLCGESVPGLDAPSESLRVK